MEKYILIALVLVLLALVVLIYLTLKNNQQSSIEALKSGVLLDIKESRLELSGGLRANRDELNRSIAQYRKETTDALRSFEEQFTRNVKDFNEFQRLKFDQMQVQQEVLVKTTEAKLEKMRETVDEKLHKTLEERLGQSFKLVLDQLEKVQKGLGEMQTLANGVGDLKKVLTNVKTRGTLGEMQLGAILEQILAPEQYESNVKTKANSSAMVEYAIKLPGTDDTPVWLPIDAKFPQEDYVRLQDALEAGDAKLLHESRKALEKAVKVFAKQIHDKYIDPPNTTNFAIMFLPVEGLYAELVRTPDLIALLQRDYKIVLTGPTTFVAILNSLQMGFKTLAIQKRSGEVWKVLGEVKTEFGKFGEVLERAQGKLMSANQELDKLVTTRTNQINRKLKSVETLGSTIQKSSENTQKRNLVP